MSLVRLMVACAVLAAPGAAAHAAGTNGNGAGPNGYGLPVLEVWKAQRKMELRNAGGAVEAKFPIVLGMQPREPKRIQGDGRTPVGRYYISEKNERSRFRRFLGLNYPNIDDAERGYWDRLIDSRQWADIFFANLRGDVPPWSTRLGGRVGIHGYGGRPELPVDWTEGCIAVPDADIDFIFYRVPIGTPVVIHE
jgi:murein L,D-transpeptidase YafK